MHDQIANLEAQRADQAAQLEQAEQAVQQAIVEGRFVPLRLIDGKLVPPPRALRDPPPTG